MAIIKVTSSKSPIAGGIKYILNQEKTEEKLYFGKDIWVSSIRCVTDQMEITKYLFRKIGGRTYQHFIVSFHEDENISYEEVRDFTEELIARTKMFDEFQVIGAVHTDTKHKVAHFIVNSVAFTDGHKFQRTIADLKNLQKLCNQMCLKKGLTITKKGYTFSGEERTAFTSFNKNSYFSKMKKSENR